MDEEKGRKHYEGVEEERRNGGKGQALKRKAEKEQKGFFEKGMERGTGKRKEVSWRKRG